MSELLSVVKHSAAIHMANTLSVTQRKIYNSLLYHSRPKLARGVDHVIETAELEAVLGFTPNNRPYLVQQTERLRDQTVRYNIFGKDKENAQAWKEVWQMRSGLLAEVGFTLNNSLCRYSFPNTIIDLLRDPNLYARINLEIQSRIRGQHALPLYEFYLDALGGKRHETEIDFSLADFRELLDLGDSSLAFKVLNRDIIGKAHKEINQKTDIRVNVVDRVRRGRSIVGLRLHLCRAATEGRLKPPDEKPPQVPIASNLADLLFDVFGSQATVKRILAEYPDHVYVRTNVAYACEMHAKGRVRNLPAYAMKALQEDYRPKVSARKAAAEDRRKKNDQRLAGAQEADQLKREFATHRLQAARERFDKLAPKEQKALHAAFEDTPEYKGVRKTIKRGLALDSPMYAHPFFMFVADNLCTESEFNDIAIFARCRKQASDA